MNGVIKFALLFIALFAGGLVLASCSAAQINSGEGANTENTLVTSDDLPENQATAVFAMGCFWCAEADFEKVDGVLDVISGYTGGTVENPTYRQVTAGGTGHYEAILVTYDTTKLTYTDLLSVFWKNVDPFDAAGQFCDKGGSYRAAIFPDNKEELEAATKSKAEWAKHFGRDIATGIVERGPFYEAEGYHQAYYKKNPVRYNLYRRGCGRDARLAQVWGTPAI